jgi:hypothetical protein
VLEIVSTQDGKSFERRAKMDKIAHAPRANALECYQLHRQVHPADHEEHLSVHKTAATQQQDSGLQKKRVDPEIK